MHKWISLLLVLWASCLRGRDLHYSLDTGKKALKAGHAAAGDYALVAGGSKGNGYAIAEALARLGYNLVLIARI